SDRGEILPRKLDRILLSHGSAQPTLDPKPLHHQQVSKRVADRGKAAAHGSQQLFGGERLASFQLAVASPIIVFVELAQSFDCNHQRFLRIQSPEWASPKERALP